MMAQGFHSSPEKVGSHKRCEIDYGCCDKYPLRYVPKNVQWMVYNMSESLNPVFDKDMVVVLIPYLNTVDGAWLFSDTCYYGDYTPEEWMEEKFPHPNRIDEMEEYPLQRWY